MEDILKYIGIGVASICATWAAYWRYLRYIKALGIKKKKDDNAFNIELLQENILDMKKDLEESKAKIKEMSLEIEALKLENTHYKMKVIELENLSRDGIKYRNLKLHLWEILNMVEHQGIDGLKTKGNTIDLIRDMLKTESDNDRVWNLNNYLNK